MSQSSRKKSKKLQPPSAEAELLNASMLTSIRSLSPPDADFLSELIEIFLARVPVLLNDLRQSAAQNDVPRFTSASHSLKGSSGNMGADSMMMVCAWLEERGYEGAIQGHEAVIDTLEAIFQEVADRLKRDWLAGA